MRGYITIRQRREAGLEVEQITKVPLVFYSEMEEGIAGSNAEYMWTVAGSDNIEIAFREPEQALLQLEAATRALSSLFPEAAKEIMVRDRFREEETSDPKAHPMRGIDGQYG